MTDLTNIITSQDFLNDDIVQAKLANSDFSIVVSPEMELDGVKFRVLIDGHHSLAASIIAGVAPDITEATQSDHDAIGLPVEDFLAVTHMGSDFRYAVSGKFVW